MATDTASGARRKLDAKLFGRHVDFEYSETWVGYSLLFLRVVMGWTLFYAGITKVIDSEWSAGGYLTHLADANPFNPMWNAMANDWLWLIDPLNQWGLTLVGLALMLGVLVRWSAFWGAVIMLFYWLSSFPLSHAILVDDHVVYALLLFGLGAFGAGRILGVDSYLERTDLVRENAGLKLILG